MPTYEIEMLWECPNCQQLDNRGMARHCNGCGRPKSESCREYFPDDISEANAIQGSSGSKNPDWKCAYCSSDTLQSDNSKCCSECGCDRASGQRGWVAQEVIVTERADGTGRREEHHQVHIDPFESVKQRVRPEPQYYEPSRNENSDKVVPIKHISWKSIAITGSIAATIIVLLLLFRNRELNSGVRSVEWRHSVIVERRHLVPKDGWSVPFDAENVNNLGLRFHYTDHRLIGSHQEGYSDPQPCGNICGPTPSCYTTSRNCTSAKNGKANCTGGDRVCPSADCSKIKYCSHTSFKRVDDYIDVPISDPYYAWSEWQWDLNRKSEKVGTSTNTMWPVQDEIRLNMDVGPRESERSRTEESYEVTLGHHGELWKFEPKSDQEFRLYPVGSRHQIKVNMLGQVEVLKHGRY